MAEQFQDASGGNIVTPPAGSIQPDQQVANAAGTIINPALEDGNLAAIKTKLDSLTFTGSDLRTTATVTLPTEAEDGTISAGQTLGRASSLTYVFDGTNWKRLTVSGTGALKVEDGGGSLTVDGPLTDTQLRATSVPISGTVTANAGIGNFVVDDGGSSLTVDATNLDIRDLSATSDSVTARMQDGTGNALTSTGGDLDVNVTGTVGLTDTQLRATPVPVSGTVTSNIGTTNGLALNATLTDGTQKAVVRGGAKGTTTASDVTSTASGANHQILDVAIYDAAGNQITSFGGAVQQYADGTARGTATGNLMMGDDGTNIQSVSVDSTGKLNLNNISGTISLPTGAATETTLAGIKTKTDGLTYTSTRLLVDGSGVTQPISAASLPLPAGAATEVTLGLILTTAAFQARINTLGQKTMAASTPVVLASDQSAIPASQSGTWSSRIQDSSGNALTSVAGSLDVNVTGGSVTVDFEGDTADLDSGAGTDSHAVIAIGLPGAGGHVVGGTSTNPLRVDPTGTTTQPISAASLPTHGVTQSGTWTVQPGNTANTTAWLVTGTGGTFPITAASLPLPTGAATETTLTGVLTTTAFQARINTLGQKTMANSTPVVLSSDQSAIPASQSGTWNINNISGTISLPTGAATSANQTTGNSSLSSIDGKLNSLGQKAMTASAPVVIASDQSAVPVSGTVTANIGTTNGLALETSLNKLNVSQGTALGSNTGPMAQGSVSTSVPSYTDGNINPLSLTTSGALRVAVTSGTITVAPDVTATYAASVETLAPAAAATDLVTITGSGTKTIRITRVNVEYQTTATEIATLRLIKRSTANSGGTSSAPTRVSYDSTNAAPTATVLAYTANPTLGTEVGVIENRRIFTMDATPSSGNTIYSGAEIYSAGRPAQAIVLRGTSEVLALNLNGVTLTGASVFVQIEWVEE